MFREICWKQLRVFHRQQTSGVAGLLWLAVWTLAHWLDQRLLYTIVMLGTYICNTRQLIISEVGWAALERTAWVYAMPIPTLAMPLQQTTSASSSVVIVSQGY